VKNYPKSQRVTGDIRKAYHLPASSPALQDEGTAVQARVNPKLLKEKGEENTVNPVFFSGIFCIYRSPGKNSGDHWRWRYSKTFFFLGGRGVKRVSEGPGEQCQDL
jgi:hypothetical protein